MKLIIVCNVRYMSFVFVFLKIKIVVYSLLGSTKLFVQPILVNISNVVHEMFNILIFPDTAYNFFFKETIQKICLHYLEHYTSEIEKNKIDVLKIKFNKFAAFKKFHFKCLIFYIVATFIRVVNIILLLQHWGIYIYRHL